MTEYLSAFGRPLRTDTRDFFATGPLSNLVFVRGEPFRAFGRFVSMRPRERMILLFQRPRVRGGPDPMRAAVESREKGFKPVYDLRPWIAPPPVPVPPIPIPPAPPPPPPPPPAPIQLAREAPPRRKLRNVLSLTGLDVEADNTPLEAIAAAILLLGG